MKQLSFDLLVPDRFESLVQKAPHNLNSIIVPVEEALDKFDYIFGDMSSAGRGAFVILRGSSGSGKSTFLHTIGMYREGVEVFSIAGSADIRRSLEKVAQKSLRVGLLVLEDREALLDIPVQELERDLHAINSFLRSPAGHRFMVVWPCNTDDLEQALVRRAREIGGGALLGSDPVFRFNGPLKSQFRRIAENTVAVLNQGATLSDLGVSEEALSEIVNTDLSVGDMLSQIRAEIRRQREGVTSLLKKEQCKLWVVVAAGNEPDKDVAALTRGRYSAVDIERLMSATDANIVKELKSYPDKLGILGTVLDAKIFHLPMLAALDCARSFADPALRERMQKANLSDKATASSKPLERLANTDLGRLLAENAEVKLARGGKTGSNTEEAFKKLAGVAQAGDVALNRAIGEALKAANYISSFATEKDLGAGLTRKTDIYCESGQGVIRIEMMWRTNTSRAEIANYVLTKLFNYGRAIGFLDQTVKAQG